MENTKGGKTNMTKEEKKRQYVEEKEKEEKSERLTKEEEEEKKEDVPISLPTFSDSQRQGLQWFEEGKSFFLTGSGGTGKSHLIREIFRRSVESHKKIQLVAMTGTAALLIHPSAKTLHSFFCLGIMKDVPDVNHFIEERFWKIIRVLKELDVLIVDEVSMMSARIFEIVIGMLKRCKVLEKIQLIFVGDFFQLPPVPNYGDPESKMFCFEHPLWETIFPPSQCLVLTHIFRQSDNVFQTLLNQMRVGRICTRDIQLLNRHVNRPVLMEETHGVVPCKIFSKKANVDQINQEELDKLPSEAVVFEPRIVNKYEFESMLLKSSSSSTSFVQKRRKNESSTGGASPSPPSAREIQYEVSSMMKETINPSLTLKVGAAVMLTRNISLTFGLCNGAQGKVIGFVDRHPQVQFGSTGEIHVIEPFEYISEKYKLLSVFQYPLILAWAGTIHKMQGSSVEFAELDLGSSIFESGQMYVALSRVKSLQGLYLKSFDPSRLFVNPKVAKFYQDIERHQQSLSAIPSSSSSTEPNISSFSPSFVSHQTRGGDLCQLCEGTGISNWTEDLKGSCTMCCCIDCGKFFQECECKR